MTVTIGQNEVPPEKVWGRIECVRDDGTAYMTVYIEDVEYEGEMLVKEMDRIGLEEGQLFDIEHDGEEFKVIPRPIKRWTQEEIAEAGRIFDEKYGHLFDGFDND